MKFTKVFRQEMLTMYANGATLTEIAEKYRSNEKSVYRALNRAEGYSEVVAKLRKDRDDAILEAFEKGESLEEIAARHNISASRVNAILVERQGRHKNSWRYLPEETRQAIFEQYRQKVSTKVLAEQYGLGMGTIYRILNSFPEYAEVKEELSPKKKKTRKRRRRRTTVNEERAAERKQVLEDYLSGKSVQQIAEERHRSAHWVYRALPKKAKDMSSEKGTQFHAEMRRKAILEDYDAGCGVTELAELYSLTPEYIYSILAKKGRKVSPEWRQEQREKKAEIARHNKEAADAAAAAKAAEDVEKAEDDTEVVETVERNPEPIERAEAVSEVEGNPETVSVSSDETPKSADEAAAPFESDSEEESDEL